MAQPNPASQYECTRKLGWATATDCTTNLGESTPNIATSHHAALVTLGLSRNQSVERIKGNQTTFDSSQWNNLRSCACGFGGGVLVMFVLRILSRWEEEFLPFYSESSSVRSGDSGLDSPEAHRPCGRSIGHGRGVDKGDEFSMQLSGVPAPDRSYVVSPRRDPDLSSYVVPLVESPTSVCPVYPLVCTLTPHPGVFPLTTATAVS